jgi:glycerophosphoryl diester phosphodiesterase
VSTSRLPRFVAHRFGRAYGPDSSPQALEVALARPVDGVETDCCLTADAQIVLIHEPLLPLSVSLEGWAAERSAEEICGSRILAADGAPSSQSPLRLQNLLERIRGRDLIVQLEVKSIVDSALAVRTAVRLCELLADQDDVPADRLEILSFWPEACAAAAAHGFSSRPIVACAYAPERLVEWLVDHGIGGLVLEARYFAEEVIDVCHEAGVSVASGLVNDVALLERVLQFAPDAVTSDDPHGLREAAEAGQ